MNHKEHEFENEITCYLKIVLNMWD